MKKTLMTGKEGTSMIFALLLFLFMAVLGINLVNAVNAKTSNTGREFAKEQELLYLASIFEVVDGMIQNGSFADAGTGAMPLTAKADIETPDSPGDKIQVEIRFKSSNAVTLTANISMKYQSNTYLISGYYKKAGTGNQYKLERCNGLEGKN